MMAALANNFVNTAIDSPQVIYASPVGGIGTRIDSFTATNNSDVNASYKAYIKTATGETVPIVPMTVVVWGEFDLGLALVNQVIPAGGSLRVESSALESIYFTVSGIEL